MLLTADFYRRFTDYEYILIHQLDVFLFEDKLLEFCDMGYDYIGAPYPKFDAIWHLLEARGVSTPPWIRDLTEATFHAEA